MSTGSKLICYVAGPRASVHRDDILALVDLFHTLPAGGSIDMLVHTSGGDVDAAEKIASMLRKRVGPTARFRVIVPDFAKSAGTLLALASDTLVMSDSSELGPVDPQLNLPDGRGGRQYQPAQSYLDGYEELLKLVNDNPDAAGYRQMLDKYDPTTVDLCRKAIERSKKLAETLLQAGMFRCRRQLHSCRGAVGRQQEVALARGPYRLLGGQETWVECHVPRTGP